MHHLTKTVCLLCVAFAMSVVTDVLHAAEPQPIGHWLFQPPYATAQRVMNRVTRQRTDVVGTAALWQHGKTAALILDGQTNEIPLATDITKAALPKAAFTVEAWVRLDTAPEWGGIVSVIQDNGNYEKGWLLGSRKETFAFALSTTGANDGDGVLTYLTSKTTFKKKHWYHVVGTYDGKTQRIYINGKLDNTSTVQSGDIYYPPKTTFTLGAYRDDNEHYRINGMLHEVVILDGALPPEVIAKRYAAKQALFPEPPKPYRVAVGPYVTFVNDEVVKITWETGRPGVSVIEYGVAPAPGSNAMTEKREAHTDGTTHTVTLHAIKRDTEYSFRIRAKGSDGADLVSPVFRFDSTFNYLPRDAGARALIAFGNGGLADKIVEQTGIKQGYGLLLGVTEQNVRLAYDLAHSTDMQLVIVEPDTDKVAWARSELDGRGVYGVRVSVHRGSLDALPYGPYFANLIVAQRGTDAPPLPKDASKLKRLLRPLGGVLYVTGTSADDANQLKPWLDAGGFDAKHRKIVKSSRGHALLYIRPKLAGSGDWSHQYGTSANTACSEDDLVTGDLTVAWWGRPGPRPMPDRGARNPAPLAAGGRLYIQGDRILFSLDQYNGTILWSMMTPSLRRTNMPRDGSNMAAADDYLYIVSGQYCEGIDGQTGRRKLKFRVPEIPGTPSNHAYDWGRLVVHGDLLIGTAVQSGAAYQGDNGEWYDHIKPNEYARVVGRYVFALDRHTGRVKWIRKGGVLIDSTLTVTDTHVYYIESRDDAAIGSDKARMTTELNKAQHLVALDLSTGRTMWDKAHDFAPATVMTYLTFANDTLMVTGSDTKRIYHQWAFDAKAGSTLWSRQVKDKKGHHGGQLQHPVVIGDRVFVNKQVVGLRNGRLLQDNVAERRGCGTMAASKHALFFRHYYHGIWDLKTNERKQFLGIRGGCWLGQIPAGGLLLAPETSSGCSCTHALQTSVGFVPRVRAK